MTVSWFRSDNNNSKVPMKEAVKALYPPLSRLIDWDSIPNNE